MASGVNKKQHHDLIISLKKELISSKLEISSGIFPNLFSFLSKLHGFTDADWRSFIEGYPEHFHEDRTMVKLQTSMEICSDHCSSKCSNPSCLGLHVCRFFFLNSCSFDGDACRFGHDLQTDHNLRVLHFYILDGLTVEEIGKIMRRFRCKATRPRICQKKDPCPKGDKCQDLHVCRFFIEGNCRFGSGCNRSHNLNDDHSMKVLTSYGMDKLPTSVIREELCACQREQRAHAAGASKGMDSERFKQKIQKKEAKQSPSSSPKDQLQNFITALMSQFITCKMQISIDKFSDCFNQLSASHGFSNLDWRTFIHGYPDHFFQDGKMVRLKTSMKICSAHSGPNGCPDAGCLNLHICPSMFLKGCQSKDESCTNGHDLHSPHNLRVLRHHLLDGLSQKEISDLLRKYRCEATLPRVCRFYGKGRCTKGDKCNDLHVCWHFLKGNCSYGEKCKKSHTLTDDNTMRILTSFALNKLPSNVVKQMFMDGLPGGSDEEVRGSSVAASNSEPKKTKPEDAKLSSQNNETSVCLHHLVKQCKYGEKCFKVHASEPYQWQYEASEDEWTNVPPEANEALQRSFEDPAKRDGANCSFTVNQ